MFRKVILTIAATAALGAAALAPAPASAGWKGGGWHGHHHGGWHRGTGFYGPRFVAYGGCHMTKRWVGTAHGARLRWVRVCY